MKRMLALCSSLLLLGMVVMAATPDSKGEKTVPRYLRGVLEGRFTFEQWGQEWWEIDTLGDVAGTLRHLGLSKMFTRHTPNLDGRLTDGEFTIVAANGDEIRGTYTGSGEWISETQVIGMAVFSIEEGTGRFVHAAGMISAAFLETFDDPTYDSAKVAWTFEGTVRY